MRPSDPSNSSYVARIERIESDSRGANVKVHVRWYYRPEESIGGRRQFHGSKEVFLSDHCDIQSADTIEGKCTVHSFKSYTKLDAVGNEDFFCRFEYNSSTGAFNPDRVAVYVDLFLSYQNTQEKCLLLCISADSPPFVAKFDLVCLMLHKNLCLFPFFPPCNLFILPAD
ncbi:Chromatin remodeling protein SHL [Linum perenne]